MLTCVLKYIETGITTKYIKTQTKFLKGSNRDLGKYKIKIKGSVDFTAENEVT